MGAYQSLYFGVSQGVEWYKVLDIAKNRNKIIFLAAQMVKNLPAMQTQVLSLGLEDRLEKGMATHCSILAWRIHGQRALVDYHSWGRKRDTTE